MKYDDFLQTDTYKYIKCSCGGTKMKCLYNYRDAVIDFYCTECDEKAHTRHVLYNPLENIQNDIIDLLKMVYVDDIKGMSKWVKENLKVTKVTLCQNMGLLMSSWEILYKKAEGAYG